MVFSLTAPTTASTPVSGAPTVLYQDNFGESAGLQSDWKVEETDSIIIAYVQFTPPSDHYTVSCRVKSSQLGFFALGLSANELPLIGAMNAYQLEMGTGDASKLGTTGQSDNGYNWFSASRIAYGSVWTSSCIYGPPQLNTYYILEMKVTSSPYQVTYTVYSDDMTPLATYKTGTVGDGRGQTIPDLGDSITYPIVKYVVLQSWGGPSEYQVDWVKIIN